MASVEIMLRFKEKDKDKKNRKAAFIEGRRKLREERDKVFYRFGGAAPNRAIKPRKQTFTLDGKIVRTKNENPNCAF